jgi:integrase
MTIAEEYRRNAHQCREQAGKSVQIGDKAVWLKLAEDWQCLAEQVDAGSARFRTVPIEANGVVIPTVAWTGNDEIKAEQGFEPPEPGKTEQRSDSYGAIVDRFIELYAKPRHRLWNNTERVLKSSCKAWLHRPINEITKKDAYDILGGYITEGKHGKAALTQAWLKTFWRWAYERNLVAEPMMEKVKVECHKRIRDKAYSEDEIAAAWNASNRLDAITSAYFKLLILLAPRKTALARMRWRDLNPNMTVWTTPAQCVNQSKKQGIEKQRTYATPLPLTAQRVLKRLPKSDDRVFPAFEPKDYVIRKLVLAGGPDGDFHCWRHTVATWLQEQGYSAEDCALVLKLGYAGVVNTRFRHSSLLARKRELLDQWAKHIERIVGRSREVSVSRLSSRSAG